jgi:exosome complex RNA-binding protein Rrp42 (RNase PH superfamily)
VDALILQYDGNAMDAISLAVSSFVWINDSYP